MGLDVGKVRVGVALSDPLGYTADGRQLELPTDDN
jgi:RNase H-fold protein (predicted Holliday junction resolvase)